MVRNLRSMSREKGIHIVVDLEKEGERERGKKRQGNRENEREKKGAMYRGGKIRKEKEITFSLFLSIYNIQSPLQKTISSNQTLRIMIPFSYHFPGNSECPATAMATTEWDLDD